MATIALTLPADGDTLDAADVNNPLNIIKDVINGNIDQDNIKAASITAANCSSEIVNVGEIRMYGGATAPTGWLLCDGTAINRTTYAALYAVTSTTFGIGDNSTTFNVPDMRGRTTIGVGTGTGGGTSGTGVITGGTALTARARGAWLGGQTTTSTHTHTGDSHTHTGPAHYHDSLGEDSVCFNNDQVSTCPSNFHALGAATSTHGYTSTSGTGATGASGTGATGAMSANATPAIMQPSVTVNYIIKT